MLLKWAEFVIIYNTHDCVLYVCANTCSRYACCGCGPIIGGCGLVISGRVPPLGFPSSP